MATRKKNPTRSKAHGEGHFIRTPPADELLRIQYVDLDEIELAYLKYAPAYAIEEARQAILRVRQLQSQRVLGVGVYYLVLIDLVGSTKFTAKYGNEAATGRIEKFVSASFNSLNTAKLRNVGLFVKEIGDAVLFVFSHFTDILSWLHHFRIEMKVWDQTELEPYRLRTCVHIGEVSLDGVNPLSLGVSQTFKMEKGVAAGDIVLTYPAFTIAWPSLARATKAFKEYGSADLDGFPEPVQLYQLVLHDDLDLERIVAESRRHHD